MGQPDGLVEWYRSILDHQERTLRGVQRPKADLGRWSVREHPSGEGVEVQLNDFPPQFMTWDEYQAELFEPAEPDREALADIAAHRAILELHAPRVLPRSHPTHRCQECGDIDEAPVEWPCPTVRHLATAYAGRDGWREEWGPR